MNISELLEQSFSKGKIENNFYKIGHDEYAQGMVVNQTLKELKKALEEQTIDYKKTITILNNMGFNTINVKDNISLDKFLSEKTIDFPKSRYETALKNIIVWNESTSSSLGEKEMEDLDKMNKLQKLSENFNKVYSGKYRNASAVKDINQYLTNLYSIVETTFLKEKLASTKKSKGKQVDISSDIIENIKKDISENLLIGTLVGGNKIVIPINSSYGMKKRATFSDLLNILPQLILSDKIPVTKAEGKLETPYYDTILSFRKLLPSVKEVKLKGLTPTVSTMEKNENYSIKTLKLDEIERNNETIFDEVFSSFVKDENEKISIIKLINAFSDSSKLILGLDNLRKYAVREKELYSFNNYIVEIAINLNFALKKFQMKYGYLRDVKSFSDKDNLVLNINNVELEDFVQVTKQNKDLKENLDFLEKQIEKFNKDNSINEKNEILKVIEESFVSKFAESEQEDIEINKFLLNIKKQIVNYKDGDKLKIKTEININNFDDEVLTLDFKHFNIFEDFNELSNQVKNIINKTRNNFIESEIPTKKELYFDPKTLSDSPFKSDQVFSRIIVDYLFDGGRVPSIVSNAGDGKTTVISSLLKIFSENFAKEVAHNQDSILNILKEGENNIPSKEMFSKSLSMLEEYFNQGTTTFLLLDEFIAAVNKAMIPMETPVEYMEILNSLLDPDTTVKIKAPLTKKGYLNVNLQDFVKIIMTGNDPINDKIKNSFPQFMQRVQETVVDNSGLWQDINFIEKASFRILNSEIDESITKTASNYETHLLINNEVLENLDKYFPEFVELENTKEGTAFLNLIKNLNENLSLDTFEKIFAAKDKVEEIIDKGLSKEIIEKLLTVIKIKENQDFLTKIYENEELVDNNQELSENEKVSLQTKFIATLKAESVLKLIETEGDIQKIISDNNLYSLEDVSNYVYEKLTHPVENKKIIIEKFGIEMTNDKEINKTKIETSLISVYNKFETNNLWLYKKGELKNSIENNCTKEHLINTADNIELKFDRVNLNILNFIPNILQLDLLVKDIVKQEASVIKVKHPEGFDVRFIDSRVPNFDFCKNDKNVKNISAINTVKANIEDSLKIITDIVTVVNKVIKDSTDEEGYSNINIITYRLIKLMEKTYINDFNGKDKISVEKILNLTLQSGQIEDLGEDIIEKLKELTNDYSKNKKVLNAPINVSMERKI